MRKSYADRADLDKIHAQWKKLTGLHTREEWSGAMVRAATAAELAANFAVREEFKKASQLNAAFVNHLLRWANGLGGKMDNLLVPLSAGTANAKTMRTLNTLAKKINTQRNTIVHQGHFMNEHEARTLISDARSFIETLVHVYEPAFVLKASTK